MRIGNRHNKIYTDTNFVTISFGLSLVRGKIGLVETGFVNISWILC